MNFSANKTIDTPRLRLRPLVDSDARALFKIMSDVEVMRYWHTMPWTALDQAHEAINRASKGIKLGNYLSLGLERKSDRALIGTCMYFNVDKHCRRAELGYGLASSVWGKGFMREALHAFLHLGFKEFNFNRIEAEIDARNVSSAKSLEYAGFNQDGFLKQRWIVHGELSDSLLYGLLAEQWQRTRLRLLG